MDITAKKSKQMSETFILGMILAAAGGFLDAYTYISRGGVFANAQTGNIVLLGISLADGKLNRAVYYLVPIMAFVLGIFIAESVRHKYRDSDRMHWRQLVVILEIFVLIVVALIPQGNLNMIANVAVSFTCAMQVEAFRKMNGNAFATTMCTGNLRSATEKLFRYAVKKEQAELGKSVQYYGIILVFIVGGMAGYRLTKVFAEKAVLIVCVLLMIVFLLMFLKPAEIEAEEESGE